MRKKVVAAGSHQPFTNVFETYRNKLIAFEKARKIGDYFSVVYEGYALHLKRLLEERRFSELTAAYLAVWKHVEPHIKVKDHYYSKRYIVFQNEEERAYQKNFKILQKKVLTELETEPDSVNLVKLASHRRKYLGHFLKVVTLFCKKYHLNLSLSDDLHLVVEKNLSPAPEAAEYYMFYNRSHIEKMDVGIGKIRIENEAAYVDYYYKPTVTGRSYDTLETRGTARYYCEAAILMLSNVKDVAERDFYKSNEPVESCYLLKQYRQAQEHILLGVVCSWNRDKAYPVSSAVVLIEKVYYDETLSQEARYQFDIENIIHSKTILPRIFYFLYNQSISLESVIDENIQKATDKKLPFENLDQIPFFNNEAKHLKLIEGYYQGLSIIPHENGFWLILSSLLIDPTGIVTLVTHVQATEKPVSNENKGFVKYIQVDGNLNGKVYISLRYNFAKHYNSLNHYLDFRLPDKTKSDGILKGAFAGVSLVTTEAVAGTVIFQKIPANLQPEIRRLKISEGDNSCIETLRILCNQYPTLFAFFQRESDHYTNSNGVQFLRKILAFNPPSAGREPKRFDIFISVPLISSGTESEYERNCLLVKRFITDIVTHFSVKEDAIYCACLHGSETLSFTEYIERNDIGTFEKVQDRLKYSKSLILLYPERMYNTHTSISSSLMEVGSAIALEKEVLIFCDYAEHQSLPRNLINLYATQTFYFRTEDKMPFDPIFDEASSHRKIAKCLAKESRV